jgi:hypothetical protein
MPAVAVTRFGAVSVNSGSRMATRHAAEGSPQAIFMWLVASAMTA